MPFGKGTLADALMAPTTIYVKPVLKLLDAGIKVRGMSHITGGGITGNLPRAFAKGIAAVVDTQGWKRPAIFDWLQEKGGVEQDEMRSEEHTSELQSLMRISYAVFCLQKKK